MRFVYIPSSKINDTHYTERLLDTQTGQVWFRNGSKWELLIDSVAEVDDDGDRDRVRLLR